MILEEAAPAKLNLALHVRGKRADGYHDLETIFAFTEFGDRLSAEPAATLTLAVEGPFAADVPAGKDNLVLRAARALGASGARLRLTKNLPVASGIGGGSADAAAALRLLNRLWGSGHSLDVLARIGAAIGADVPACVYSRSLRGEGKGDTLVPVEMGLAGTPVLLVNPRVGVSTAAVFAAWDGLDRGPLSDVASGRNDLQAPAMRISPAIREVLAALEAAPGALPARMSGSGATCFARFADHAACKAAAARLADRAWWVCATQFR